MKDHTSAISVPAIDGGLTLFEKSPKDSFDPVMEWLHGLLLTTTLDIYTETSKVLSV